VDRLEGSEESKQRLRVILESLAGGCTVEQACERLQVSEARFHELRHQALQAALAGLSPRPAGRPAHAEPEEAGRVQELERKVEDLEVDLHAERVRTEIALTMPHLLRDGARKKKTRKARRSRPPHPDGRSGGTGSGSGG
jgi:transposase